MQASVDKELVKAAQKGNKQAFDLLVQKYQFRIMKLIGRYVKDTSEMRDIAQEVFIKAYRALHHFRGESAFYTWLYRIAINTTKNYVVAQDRLPQEIDYDQQVTEQKENQASLKEMGSPEHLLLRDELEQAVFGVINQLPKDLKTAITLRELDGLSYEDIAEIMDCPIGTVRSRIFRAREAIDKVIQPLLKEE